jgi:hypothetical protein
MKENESCQTNLKNTSFNSVYRADSESVISLWLEVLFEVENYWIPPKMARVPVKNYFSQHNKGKIKKWSVAWWAVVGWEERDKIYDSITYLEKLERFTKSAYT